MLASPSSHRAMSGTTAAASCPRSVDTTTLLLPVTIDPYSVFEREGDFDHTFRSPRSPFNPPQAKQARRVLPNRRRLLRSSRRRNPRHHRSSSLYSVCGSQFEETVPTCGTTIPKRRVRPRSTVRRFTRQPWTPQHVRNVLAHSVKMNGIVLGQV